LIGQLRWVTRLSAALGHESGREDLYSIVLSAVVSPFGLDYSQAFLFTVDRANQMLRGVMGMGPATRKAALALGRELRAESDYIRQMADSAALAGEESGFDPFSMLSESAHWISMTQNLAPSVSLSRALAQIQVPLAGGGAPRPDENFLLWAAGLTGPTRISRWEEAPPLPPPLEDILKLPAVVAPLRSSKGLSGLILADRRFSRRKPVTRFDLQEFDWFATQASLALEKSELIRDLETANCQLQELDTLKSNFLSIVSHELRTPMTAIMGVTEILLSDRAGPMPSQQRSLLMRAQKNAVHLLQIVNDLIEVTEVRAEGMRNIRLRPVDPLSVFFNTLPKLEQRRRYQNVEVEPVIYDSVPRILCDARSLERILFHLLDNAIKFSERGRRVEVEFRPAGGRLHIAVRDQGIGIPPDRLKKIFESFYQVDSRLSRSFEGLGLGLTVIQMLVTATEGEIQVASREGEGSCFTISYPIVAPGENP